MPTPNTSPSGSTEPELDPADDDPMMEFMRKKGIPLTRENYMNLNYGDPHKILIPELEAEMPLAFRKSFEQQQRELSQATGIYDDEEEE